MMITIKHITQILEEWAPLPLQESYDNSGLLVGDGRSQIDSAIITLDVTEEVVDEAIKLGSRLIISHHPFIFSGLKKISGNTSTERILIKAVKNNIAIYAIHTNLDNIKSGVNMAIAEKIGLQNLKILKPVRSELKKLISFCPVDHVENVRKAIFDSGAGQIGNYDQCSFNILGYGTFRAGKDSSPFVGKINETHHEEEVRIETVFPSYLAGEVIRNLISAHPYEEVAYDIYPIENSWDQVGAGMIGELSQPVNEDDFLDILKKLFGVKLVRHSKLLGKQIKTVAFCGGSGSFLIPEAKNSGAEIYVSGDIKYHQFFDAEGKIVLADIGHFESEQFTRQLIYDYLMQKFPNFALRISKVDTNSVNYF